MSGYQAPWINEELSILLDSVEKFAELELAPNDARWQKQGYIDRDVWRKAAEQGLLCASIPVKYGGAGCSFYHEAIIMEGLFGTHGGAGFGGCNTVHGQIAAHYILAYGTEDQKMRWLPKMATGEKICAIAMTEPSTGSDLKNVKTSAKRDGQYYVIDGSKTFITNGQLCDLIILVAKTDSSLGAKGISLIIVETAELEGFQRGRNLEKIGLKSQDTSELFFDRALVPTDNLLGMIEGKGFDQLIAQLPQERLSISVAGIAAMEKALILTCDYVKNRNAFDGTVMDFQNTRFKLAEVKTIAHIARVFVDNCIGRHVNGGLDAVTASMAKWWVSQMQCDVMDECLQLHGGYGYMAEYPIAQLYTDARVQKIYGGTNEIMKELIARSL